MTPFVIRKLGDAPFAIVLQGAEFLAPYVAASSQSAAAALASATTAGARMADAQAAAGDARGTAQRMVVTSSQYYAGVTRRFAYGVVDRYGRARGGFLHDGCLYAQRLTGPSGRGAWAFRVTNAYGRVGFAVDTLGAITGGGSKNGFAFVVRNAYGRPGFAIGNDGSVWTKDGLLGSIAAPARTAIAGTDTMAAVRMVAPDLIERVPGVRLSVLLLGDSQWRESWGGANVPLCKALYRRYGYGGPGFVALAMLGGHPHDIAGAMRGAVSMTPTGQWSELPDVSWSPCTSGLQATAAGAALTFAYTGGTQIATVRLLHGGGDPITYAYNGGAETQVALTADPGAIDLPTPPGIGFTLTIKATGTLRLAGPVFTAASGVVIHNAALGGLQTDRYSLRDQTAYRAALARLDGLDAALIGLGGNDEASNVTPDDFEARARIIIGSIRAVSPGAALGWVFRAQTPRSTVPERMAAYAARYRQIAPQLQSALFESVLRCGESYAEYGFTGTKRSLFQADAVHVSRAGAAILGGGAAELLLARD